MTQTIKAEAWTHKRCASCGVKHTMPEDANECPFCEEGLPSTYHERRKAERLRLRNVAAAMLETDVTLDDLAHEIQVKRHALERYASGRWKTPFPLAETLALYLDTSVEELTKP